MSSIDTEVDFDTWLAQLKARFIAKGGMTDEEARGIASHLRTWMGLTPLTTG